MPAGKKNVQGSNNSTTFAKQAALQTNKTENNLTHKSTPRNDVLLESLTKEQLKAECRKRGRKTSGNKADLVFMLMYLIRLCCFTELDFACAFCLIK